jgi:hypothetical protein
MQPNMLPARYPRASFLLKSNRTGPVVNFVSANRQSQDDVQPTADLTGTKGTGSTKPLEAANQTFSVIDISLTHVTARVNFRAFRAGRPCSD